MDVRDGPRSMAKRRAPAGMAFLAIDLRGRSLDVAGAAGATGPAANTGVAFEVPDWRERLMVVADTEYAYPVSGERGLGESAKFLPGVMTGGEVAFLVPDKTDSLEVRWDFEDDPGRRAGGHDPRWPSR